MLFPCLNAHSLPVRYAQQRPPLPQRYAARVITAITPAHKLSASPVFTTFVQMKRYLLDVSSAGAAPPPILARLVLSFPLSTQNTRSSLSSRPRPLPHSLPRPHPLLLQRPLLGSLSISSAISVVSIYSCARWPRQSSDLLFGATW